MSKGICRILAFGVVTSLISCGTLSTSELSIEQLCSVWRHDTDAFHELKARAPFSDREWRAINEQKLFVGMSENAALCSRGIPDEGSISLISVLGGAPSAEGTNGHILEKTGDWGVRRIYQYFSQWDLDNEWNDKHLWVFVENNVVVSFGTGWEDVSRAKGPGSFFYPMSVGNMFDFSLLKPAHTDAPYALQEQ